MSLDLQKRIIVPRLDMYGRWLFAIAWNEAKSGLNQEDIISALKSFFIHKRDVKYFICWLDNFSNQNKNLALFSFLIYTINGISTETITINYFEPGHKFRSADSFHHQVEESLKKLKKVYDFKDFVHAAEICTKRKMNVKQLSVEDFQF